ncbi:MAG: flagellar hook-length control protein FliK [Ectothiorhodospira sp.]
MSAEGLRIQLSQGGQTALRNLQQGQILQARVLTSAAAGGHTLLRLPGAGLEARLPVPVQAGQQLTLQVTNVHPRLQLTLLPTPAAQTAVGPIRSDPVIPSGSPSAEARAPLMRQWAPAQSSQTPLMASLARLHTPSMEPVRQALPPAVRQAMESLWQALPRAEGVTTGSGLRQALLESGLFLEPRLARAAGSNGTRNDAPISPVARDLKGQLLSLAQQLRSLPLPARGAGDAAPTPQEPPPPLREGQPVPQGRDQGIPPRPEQWLLTLRQQVEGSLARLVMHQLASTEKPDEAGQSPRWFLELPLKGEDGVDVVHMRLDREGGRRGEQDDPERPWRADLALDLPGLGPLRVRVVVRGDQVSTQFWAGEAEASERLREALPRLRESLEARKLDVVSLQCRNAPPPTDPPGPNGDTPIVDGMA